MTDLKDVQVEASISAKTAANEVKLLCVSWNVGNAEPKEFEELIPVDGEGYDLVAIGKYFQVINHFQNY